MRRVILSIYLLLVPVLFHCGNPGQNEDYSNINNPRFDLTYEKLVNAGFTVARGDGIDVPILEKKTNDKLIYYQFDNEEIEKPLYMFYQSTITHNDSLNFVDSLSARSVYLTQDNYSTTFLTKGDNNLYYRCSIRSINESSIEVNVQFDYPRIK